jgi:hypothetical protein
VRRIPISIASAFAVVAITASSAFAAEGDTDPPSRLEDLRSRLTAVERSLDDANERIDLVASQRDAALEGQDAAERQADAAHAEAIAWRMTTYLAIGLLLVMGMVALVRRRTSIRIKIPDTAEELLHPSGRGRER